MIEEKKNHKLLTYFVNHRRIWEKGKHGRVAKPMSVQLSTYGVIKFTFTKQRNKQKFMIFHDFNGGNLIKGNILVYYKATISKECYTLIVRNLLSQWKYNWPEVIIDEIIFT